MKKQFLLLLFAYVFFMAISASLLSGNNFTSELVGNSSIAVYSEDDINATINLSIESSDGFFYNMLDSLEGRSYTLNMSGMVDISSYSGTILAGNTSFNISLDKRSAQQRFRVFNRSYDLAEPIQIIASYVSDMHDATFVMAGRTSDYSGSMHRFNNTFESDYFKIFEPGTYNVTVSAAVGGSVISSSGTITVSEKREFALENILPEPSSEYIAKTPIQLVVHVDPEFDPAKVTASVVQDDVGFEYQLKDPDKDGTYESDFLRLVDEGRYFAKFQAESRSGTILTAQVRFFVVSDRTAMDFENRYDAGNRKIRIYHAEVVSMNNEYKKIFIRNITRAIRSVSFNDPVINGSVDLGAQDLDIPGYEQSYAIDPEQMKFSNATITVTAKATALYKCRAWNFSESICHGSWDLLMDNLTPGRNYSILITPDDPAFAESFNIINVQSYPVVGGFWEVRFNTTGTANLTIAAIQNTTWQDDPQDLELRYIRCGNSSLDYFWINSSAVRVINYSCNSTGYEVSRVLTSGPHHLMFKFGNIVAYANNKATDRDDNISQTYSSTLGQDGDSPVAINFDAETFIHTGYFHSTSSDPSRIYVNETDLYKVSYGCSWVMGTASARVIMEDWVRINGATDITPSRTSCYIRDDSTDRNRCSNSAVFLVNLTDGDYLELMGDKLQGATGTVLTNNDCWMYIQRVRNRVVQSYDSTGGQDFDGTTITVNLDTDTYIDSSHFTRTNDQISVAEDGTYKIYYHVCSETTGQDSRMTLQSWLRENAASTINPSSSFSYIRETAVGDRNCEVISSIINLSSSDYIDIQHNKFDQEQTGATVTLADQSWLLLEKIDNSALMVYENTGGQSITDGSDTAVTFDTNYVVGDKFNHSPSSSSVYFEEPGLYEISYNMAWEDDGGNDRVIACAYLELDGTTSIMPSRQCDMTRGDAQALRNSVSANLILNVTAGDYIELNVNPTGSGVSILGSTTWISAIKLDEPDFIPPNITLQIPADNYFNDSAMYVNITFNCSATDNDELKNISLFITNSTDSGFSFNASSNITGSYNSSAWTLELGIGNYTWNCLVFDSYDNYDWGENRTLMINYSIPPPVVTLVYPSNNTYFSSTNNITLNYSATSEIDLINCTLWTNASGLWEKNQTLPVSGLSYSGSWNLTSLSDAGYIWNYDCCNDHGCDFAFSNNTFYITYDASSGDITPPVTTSIFPDDKNTTIFKQVTFNCSVSDDIAIANISLYLTDSQNQSFSLNTTDHVGGTSYNASWQLVLENGNYTWNCLSFDGAGNSAWGENRTLFVNYTFYPIIITNPLPAEDTDYLLYSPLNISVNTTHKFGIDKVYANITWQGGQMLLELLDIDGDDVYEFEFTSTGTTGRYDVRYIINNTLGDRNDSTTTYFNIIDNESPVVRDVLPSAGTSYTTAQIVEIYANVTDNYDVLLVEALVGWEGGSDTYTMTDDDGDDIYNASFKAYVLGQNNITIIARDPSDNINNTEHTWINVTHTTSAAVYCTSSPCVADQSLIISRDTITGTQEPNQPNTLDSCSDGTSGSFHSDESIDNITITCLNGTQFRAGDTISVSITAYCYDSSGDNINYVYANDSSSISWKLVDYEDPCPQAGTYTSTREFVLDNRTGIHAFRGIIQWNGATTATCGSGSYDDNDDLEFLVLKAREYDNPYLEIYLPNETTYFYGDEIDIAANVSDRSDIERVYAKVRYNTQEWEINLTDYDLDGIYTGTFSDTHIIGNYTITFYAIDEFSNINDSENVWFLVNDTGTLTITPLGCVPQVTEIGNNVECSANITDINAGISDVVANVTTPAGIISAPVLTNQSSVYNFTYTTSSVGLYSVKWWANNTNSVSREDYDSFNAREFVTPNVTLVVPVPGTDYNTSQKVNITVIATDDTQIDTVYASVMKPDKSTITVTFSNITSDRWSGDLTDTSSPGVYNITIIANDTSGNINDTTTTWVNISYTTSAAIFCTESPCIADSSLIISRDTITGTQEPNQPNTIDSCSDGTSGSYQSDESLDNISMRSLNGSLFRAGDTVEVNITAYCYNNADDNINVIYTNDSQDITWKVVNNIDPCPVNGGFYTYVSTFVLDDREGIHALRGSVQYQGSATSTCGTGSYDDNDDIEFQVFASRESSPPDLNITSPHGYVYSINDTITISADVYDPNDVDTVWADISWPGGSETIMLSFQAGFNYSGEFMTTRVTGQYNISYYANDTFGNLNDSETAQFWVDNSPYQIFFGNSTLSLNLGLDKNIFLKYPSARITNIFMADSESVFSYGDLQALGVAKDGTQSSQDFGELDYRLNIQNRSDSVARLWASDNSTPLQTKTFYIRGTAINNVPVVQSTNNSFETGILWDTSDAAGDEYTGVEDIVFVTKYLPGTTGKYGVYGYETKVPEGLGQYTGVSDIIYIYSEI